MSKGENKTYPNLAGEDWFIRDWVKEQLNTQLPMIAAYLVNNNIDYEDDVVGVAEVISKFIGNVNTAQFTHDEIEFVIMNIQFYTAILELREDGLIEMTDDGEYRVVK